MVAPASSTAYPWAGDNQETAPRGRKRLPNLRPVMGNSLARVPTQEQSGRCLGNKNGRRIYIQRRGSLAGWGEHSKWCWESFTCFAFLCSQVVIQKTTSDTQAKQASVKVQSLEFYSHSLQQRNNLSFNTPSFRKAFNDRHLHFHKKYSPPHLKVFLSLSHSASSCPLEVGDNAGKVVGRHGDGVRRSCSISTTQAS